MLVLKNAGPQQFKKIICNKTVFVFGAGKALESCMGLYFSEKKIEMIADNNKSVWNTFVKNGDDSVSVSSVEELTCRVKAFGVQNCLLFITSPFYAAEIVEQLDKIPELDGLETYLAVLVRCKNEPAKSFDFTVGLPKIPKKIHYMWVGGKSLPDEYKKNIDTWRKFNPDYEIIRWDESNLNLEECDYVKEAFVTKSWCFVTNYIRLSIVWNYGGIYLDTDVEVQSSFDTLLNDDAFFCMGCADRVNNGCGFGAIPHHPLVMQLKQSFENSHFLIDGKPGRKACHTFLHPVLKNYGFEIKNEYQNINGVALYPAEVMSPYTMGGLGNFFSDKTLSVHKESGTWKNEREKAGIEKLKILVKERF